MSNSFQKYNDVPSEESIDRSFQKPLSALFLLSSVWLFIASVLAAIAFWQIKFPGFIDFESGIQSPTWGWLFSSIHEMLNYGRATAAAKGILLYGWLFQGLLGVAIWISARVSKKELCTIGNYFTFGSIGLWNVGILTGLLGILGGEASGYLGFDFPKYAVLILFAGYTLAAITIGMRFAMKARGEALPQEGYLIGAIFWFPWFYLVALYFIHLKGFTGVMPALVHAWYLGGFHVLVLSGLAIAALYALIPDLMKTSIHRAHTTKSAFWLFAFLGAWSGVRYLNGGPVPAWMITTSVVAGGLLLIPGTLITNNQMTPLWANWNRVKENPVLWYLATGGISFLVWLSLEALVSLRTVSAALRFSYMDIGTSAVFEYSFLSMVLFGAIYRILPAITGKDLTCCVNCCMKRQFWLGFCGLITFFTGAFLAGSFMGLGNRFAPMAFLAVKNLASPFFWLIITGGFMMILANLIFVKNVAVTLWNACCDSKKEGCCS